MGRRPGPFKGWPGDRRGAQVLARYTSRMPVHLLFCSCPDPDTAQRLATALVQARLAACVSVLPAMRSVYRWQGVVEQAEEVLLLAKTTAGRLPALTERLRELHPYELPEIVAVEAAAGLPAYLDWVADATRE